MEMKYRCWYLGHAWSRWEGELNKLSPHFHHDSVDHFVTRWRYCERCGKKVIQRYFVPGVSDSKHSYSAIVRELDSLSRRVMEYTGDPPHGDTDDFFLWAHANIARYLCDEIRGGRARVDGHQNQ